MRWIISKQTNNNVYNYELTVFKKQFIVSFKQEVILANVQVLAKILIHIYPSCEGSV